MEFTSFYQSCVGSKGLDRRFELLHRPLQQYIIHCTVRCKDLRFPGSVDLQKTVSIQYTYILAVKKILQ